MLFIMDYKNPNNKSVHHLAQTLLDSANDPTNLTDYSFVHQIRFVSG